MDIALILLPFYNLKMTPLEGGGSFTLKHDFEKKSWPKRSTKLNQLGGLILTHMGVRVPTNLLISLKTDSNLYTHVTHAQKTLSLYRAKYLNVMVKK